MMVTSCQEEIELPSTGEDYILTATIDSDRSVRTSLSPSSEGVSRVFWSAGDRIGIYADGAEDPALFRLISGEGEREAQFSGPVLGTSYLAIYPWDQAGKADNGSISITLPQEQEYVADSFAPNSYPMIASGTAAGLAFRNLCSILKVSILGHQAVTALEFRPNDSAAMVSGPAMASLVDGMPQLTLSADGNNSVVLNVPGVLLSEDTATDFYLVLPPGTYKGGFTVRIQTSGGSMDKVYGEDFTMERSRLHKATPFVLKLDQGVDPSLGLSGSGTVEEPFLIGSLSDLLLMQATVNTVGGTLKATDGTVVPAPSAHYRLTSDIDLSPACGANSGRSWTPIGKTEETPFYGVFDGNGHTISNLFIQGEQDYQGLFGVGYDYPNIYSRGRIAGLSVTGSVTGASQIGLIVGKGGEVSYCTSSGEVVSDSETAGGIAGYVYIVDHCTNKASVRKTRGMVSSVGGIAGAVGVLCHDCRNEGDISSVEGYEVGGIAGSSYGADVYNCTNTGMVDGGQQCGGIIGVMNGTVENCLNEGSVSSGSGACGGIVGVTNPGFVIRNCINTASVYEKVFHSDNGGICGYIRGRGVIEFSFCPEAVPAVAAFYDADPSSCVAFSFSEWERNDTDVIYYTMADGYPCHTVLEALNAWAFENRTVEKGFCGWELDAVHQSGALSGKPAIHPGGENGFFALIPSAFETGPNGGNYQVRVASTTGYSIQSMPDWIHPQSGLELEGVPNNWIQSFMVDAVSGSRRTGTIVLLDGKGESASIPVTQFGRDEFDWSQSFYHRSLFFVYTCKPDSFFNPGTWTYEDAAVMANEVYPDRFLHAAVSIDGTLACPQSAAIFEKNGIDGWPTLILDGYANIRNGSNEVAFESLVSRSQTNEYRAALSTVSVQTEVSGRQLSLDIRGYFKKRGDYCIHVMLLEDGLEAYGRTNNHIVRMALSDEAGDWFSIPEDRTEKPFTYSAEIPSEYDLEKMNVLVFFDVKVSESTSMVDNAFSIPVCEHR